MLLNKDQYIRRAAAYVINKTKNSEAVQLLKKVSNDEDAGVKIYSAGALLEYKIIKVEKAIEILVEGLKDKDFEIRKIAVEEILVLGRYIEKNDNIFNALCEAVNDIDSKVREKAVMALNNMNDKKTIPALLIALKDNDPIIRRTALMGFGSIILQYSVEDNVLDPLILCIKDKDRIVRATAAGILGKTNNKIVEEPLQSALEDENAIDRISAAGALLLHGWKMDSKAGKVLKEASNSGDSQINMLASMQIAIASKEESNIVKEILNTNIEENLSMLKSKDPIDRLMGICFFMIPMEKDDRITNALIDALKDTDDNVRSNAALAIAALKITDNKAIESLILLLKDKNADIRLNACYALLGIKDIRAVPSLIETLKDADPQVKQSAKSALYSITNQDYEDDIQKWEDWWSNITSNIIK